MLKETLRGAWRTFRFGPSRGVILIRGWFGLPFYRAMFGQAGYEADIAAYDAAVGVMAQRGAISDAFIADLCAIGKPGDVAAGVARYQAAGATNPMITNIAGTDLRPTLAAAVSG